MKGVFLFSQKKMRFFLNKKCVSYPQEDFLFTILQGDFWATNLQAESKILKKLLEHEHQIYQSKQKNSTKKSVSYLKSGKGPKIFPDNQNENFP
jgi:hypothetical protein